MSIKIYVKYVKNNRDFHTTKLNLPTGALDSKSTDELLELFSAVNEEGQTILMVTHSVKAASHAKRVLFIKDGEVFHQIYRGNNTRQQMYEKTSVIEDYFFNFSKSHLYCFLLTSI